MMDTLFQFISTVPPGVVFALYLACGFGALAGFGFFNRGRR